MMELRRAEKQKTKLRVGLGGTSGSGKTYSALLLAKGLCGDYKKVAVIDTENGSADLYAGMGDYNVITLTQPFTPERYIEAINACENGGIEVIIVDSISHEWEGKGGCLEIVEAVTKASASGNSYTAWAKVTPRHQAFIQAILQSPCHIITTVRKKQDYDMNKDSNGKTQVVKLGLKEITREGFEYELTLSFNLSLNHLAETSKDRTGLFMDKPEFVITEQTGKTLKDWSQSGSEVIVTTKEVKPSHDPSFDALVDSIDVGDEEHTIMKTYPINKKLTTKPLVEMKREVEVTGLETLNSDRLIPVIKTKEDAQKAVKTIKQTVCGYAGCNEVLADNVIDYSLNKLHLDKPYCRVHQSTVLKERKANQ